MMIDGICVFAALRDSNICSLQDESLGCCGIVEKCPIKEEREVALDDMFEEMFRPLETKCSRS